MQGGAAIVSERSRQHFVALDSWRGIAALLVAVFHLQVYSHVYVLPFIRNATLWVDFFFVLSGFVIAHSSLDYVRDWPTARSFATRRIGRLWPLHLVMLLIFVLIELATLLLTPWIGDLYPRAAFTGERSLESLWFNVFLLNGLGLPGVESWNPPSWSISTEFVAYSLFALFCLAPHRWMPRLAAGAALAGGALVLVFAPKYFTRDGGFAVFRCIYCFFTGCLLLLLYRQVAVRWARVMTTVTEVVAAVLAIAFVSRVGNDDKWLAMLAPAVFGLVVLVFAFQRGRVSSLLMVRPLTALGRWSYSIYMIHFLFVFLVNNGFRIAGKFAGTHLFTPPMLGNATGLAFVGGMTWMDAVTIAYLLIVIGAAALSYRWIELPGIRLFRRFEAGGAPAGLLLGGSVSESTPKA